MEPNQNTGNSDKRISIGLCVTFGAIGAVLALLVAFIILYLLVDVSFVIKALDSNSPGGGKVYFFDESWNDETYLSVITGFYTALITILIALMGVVAAFAIFMIKGASLEKIEETTEKEVKVYFEKASTLDVINKLLGILQIERITKLEDRIVKIEQDLEVENTLPEYKLGVEDEKKTD